MKKELLKYLVCPYTQETLILSKEKYGINGEIKSGTLTSKKSKNKYLIIDYVPIMLKNYDSENFEKNMIRYEGWSYEWLNKKFEFNTDENDIGTDKDTYLTKEYKLNKIDFKNKIVLEAGCGGGRVTNAFYNRKVKNYFMLDISEAIYEARNKHNSKKNVHCIRGDITNPPFRTESVDIIICLGVLQHTENSQNALDGMTNVLKKDCLLIVSHYMWPKNFFIRLKVYGLEFIRAMLKFFHIPKGAVMAFTYMSVLSYRYILLRPIAWFFFTIPPFNDIKMRNKHTAEKIIWLNNFDAYNPQTYQRWKTEKETQIMLLKSGLTPILESKSIPNGYVCKKTM